jgi:SAM-dependent methyltransferase
MSLYGRVNSMYRSLPEPARRWADHRAPRPLRRLRRRLVSRLERGAAPDELYDAHYYENVVDPIMLASAKVIASSLERELAPRSAIDVGCGSGALMLALQQRGVRCRGFDRAEAALRRCRERGLDVGSLDIVGDPLPPDRADIAVSTEVAEHLPESAADRFVELLTALAPVTVLTAALPGSGGKDHVNEQPNAYWVAKFATRGFRSDEELAARLRDEWRAGGADEVFWKSLMIFRGHSSP